MRGELARSAAVNLLATRYLLGNIGGEKTPWDNLGVKDIATPEHLAWYPGDQGGTAIYRTLAGLNNPAGRLPITFYGDTSKLPDFEDYKLLGRTYLYGTENVVYPFGYGLSYTSFAYGKIEVSGAGELASATRRGDAGTFGSSRLASSRGTGQC